MGRFKGNSFWVTGNFDPFQALELTARQMNVDILVSGHTHVCKVYEKDNILFVNPGSATGAATAILNE
jgi:vacuolar protein sorting-associated protein 29